jgi:thymidylate synthase (FAD)
MRVELFEDGIGAVEYISHMGGDLSVVNAARVSFGTEKQEVDEKDIKLINYLMKHNHSSPFEHCMLTFKFTVPLFIRSQHHRHRTWAYNEISRRYTSVDINFYEPKEFRQQHESNRQASTDDLIDPIVEYNRSGFPVSATASDLVKTHHVECLKLFEKLLESGVCREQARGVLPQNLYTEYYGTTSLHNLLKFVSLRIHEGAQWEIQQVARACLEIAKQHFPHSVESFMKHKMEAEHE